MGRARSDAMKRKTSRLSQVSLALLLAASLLLFSAPITAFAEIPRYSETYTIMEFVEDSYIDSRTEDYAAIADSSGNLYALGLDPLFSNYAEGQGVKVRSDATKHPSHYDLRSSGSESAIASVKNRQPWNTDWAFSAVSSAESSLIMQEEANATVDLSELHLAFFTYQAISEEDSAYLGSNQTGEGAIVLESAEVLDAGASLDMAASTLSSGQGLVSEDAIPYRNAEYNLEKQYDDRGNLLATFYTQEGDWSVSAEERFTNEYQIEEVLTLPSPVQVESSYDSEGNAIRHYMGYNKEATEVIKETLMTQGAVSISCAVSSDEQGNMTDAYFNFENWSQYTNQPNKANSAVTIVGWDDEYAPSNFKSGTQPAESGAWIVKANRGSAEGNNGNRGEWGIDGSGYFYLSYYDQTISSPTVFVVSTEEERTEKAYQYDLRGHATTPFVNPLQSTEEMSIANVFTISSDQSLQSASAVTYVPGSTVSMEVYLLDEDACTPDEGTLLESQTITVDYAGYHRIEFEKEHVVNAGDRIAVVETIYDDTESDEPVWFAPLEVGASDEFMADNNFDVQFQVVANEGESFCAFAGEWVDVTVLNKNKVLTYDGDKTFGNANIKLFASEA